MDGTLLNDAAALRELYGEPSEGAIAKEIDYVHSHYRAMIEASPFMVMATSGPDGLDVSPRGDPPGFVVVEDAKTLLIPDRRGNNRTDSLGNLIADSPHRAAVPDPRRRRDAAGERAGRDLRRSRPARALSRAGQAAAIGDRGACRARVFPMPEGAGAIGPMEPREAHRTAQPAEQRHNPGGHHARPGRWNGIRRGVSGAVEGDDILSRRETELSRYWAVAILGRRVSPTAAAPPGRPPAHPDRSRRRSPAGSNRFFAGIAPPSAPRSLPPRESDSRRSRN